MRYAPGLPPLTSVKEEDEPHPLRAIRPVRPVESRTRVPQVIQRFGSKTRAGESGRSPAVVRREQRTASDRREECRRVQHGQAFLDTRIDVDRRNKKRRDHDVVTTLDEEG